MKSLDDFNSIGQFFGDLSHSDSIVVSGGFFEAVVDFNMSRYFDAEEQIDDLVQFAIDKAKAGHQVFFGPAHRKNDLGTSRSSLDNVSCSLCLWVDIDPPDKELPADLQIAASKALLDDFVQRLDEYGIKPSYVIESGHGYHVYFLLQKFAVLPSGGWQNAQNCLTRCAKSDTKVRQPAALLRVPGTLNYKKKADPLPVRIVEKNVVRYMLEDFDLLVMDMVKEANAEKAQSSAPAVAGNGKLGFTPPCIAALLDPSRKPPRGHRHQVRQILATFAFHEGLPLQEAVQKVMHTTDDQRKRSVI